MSEVLARDYVELALVLSVNSEGNRLNVTEIDARKCGFARVIRERKSL
jgi:hypothetical protein